MSNAIVMTPVPLTAESFEPFGDVIEVSDSANHFPINHGHTERYHQLAQVESLGDGANGIISIFRSNPLPLNQRTLTINSMEQHPLGSQAFMPLNSQPYLVVVAPKGPFDISKLSVFIASPEQGVNYHAGTWHHFCLALNQTSDFLVVDRAGPGNNCEEISLEQSVEILLENK